MRRKIVWLLVSCLMVAALVLASCAPAVTEEEVKEEAAVAKGPQYGGTLKVIASQAKYDIKSWDPADFLWITSHHSSPYMERLMIGDVQKGPRGTNEFPFQEITNVPLQFLRGDLAESWEFEDPTTLVFHIRKGVMWQDKPGVMAAREATAEDVDFAMNRYLTSPKCPEGRYFMIDSIYATDKWTLVIKFNKHYADWAFMMGYGYRTYLYPPEMVDAGASSWRNACGTGPFMLTDVTEGTAYTYEKNPNYWRKAIVGGKEYEIPFLDKFIFLLIKDESSQLAALRTGKADIMENVPWEFVESMKETNPELQAFPAMLGSCGSIAMRCDTPPFDDIRVRRAMNMAIDRQAYIDALLLGKGEILTYPIHKDWATVYTPIEELPESARELFEYNPEKAKQLLAEAGYPDGFKTEVMGPTFPRDMDWLSFFVDYWAKIGVDCELNVAEYGAYQSVTLQHGHTQMAYRSNTISTKFEGTRKLAYTGYSWNLAIWDDPKWMGLFEEAQVEPDLVKQDALLKEANIRFIDQCPYVLMPLGYVSNYAHPWVKNWYGETNVGAQTQGPVHAETWLTEK